LFAKGEWAAEIRRHLGSAEGGPAYAAVVPRHAVSKLPSGPLELQVKGSDSSEPAASSEAATTRMSSDISRPLSSMPDGTASTNDHVSSKIVPAGERRTSAPVFISCANGRQRFLV
jgi:hypothetical protein